MLGRSFFEKGQPYKVEIVDDLVADAQQRGLPPPTTTFYEQGPFIDLCRGPHVESTGKIGPIKLLAVSGAYWRGDQKRPAMQRVYGTAWPTQEELDHFPVAARGGREARPPSGWACSWTCSRFHDVSPGGAFWHPKGWRLYQTLRDAMREIQARRGYQEIYTPPLVHKKLWEQSGHWTCTGTTCPGRVQSRRFSLKPMNCPNRRSSTLTCSLISRIPLRCPSTRCFTAPNCPACGPGCPSAALRHGRRPRT